jgi:iduronate 2-sulfatase
MKKQITYILFSFCIIQTTGFTQNVPIKKKPNVIMILVDDLKPLLGAYGDPFVVSPNIDKLANAGIRFDLAYANQAVCGPSRYNLMLGTRSTSSGIYSFGKNFRDLYPDAVTLPQYFMNAGYHTESMGKVYHIGHGSISDDASWSVPHHEDKVIEYIVPSSTDRTLTREEAFFNNTRMYVKNVPSVDELPRGAAWESPDVLDEAYADGRTATHAIDRIRKLNTNKDKPFFMAIGFARPHLPFSVPKKYWDLYNPEQLPSPEFEGIPEGTASFTVKSKGEIENFKPIPTDGKIFNKELKTKLIHGYYASVSYMDAQVGRVLDELERLKMLDNTIIVLWGDHGFHLGDHGSWTKHSNFEQAVRIPLIFAGPGISKNSVTKQLAETVDIYPTLVELAGLSKPVVTQPFDGLSLVPVIKDSKNIIRNHAYHSYPRYRGKDKFIGQAIRTERYRMVQWTNIVDKNADKIYELYDYVDDPLETKNYATLKPDVLKEMIAIVNTHPKPNTQFIK